MDATDLPRRARRWPAWGPLWRTRTAWRGWRFPLDTCLVQLALGGGAYAATVHFNAWREVTVWSPETGLDRALPAWPWTLAVYVTLYLYSPLYALSAPRTDAGRQELVLITQTQLLVCWISCAFFALLPCEVGFRSEIDAALETAPLWRPAFDLVHRIDAPWNAWPSLHVSSTWLVVRLTRRRSRRAGALVAIAWLLLIASTFTTKQHFVFDALTGALLGELAWRVWLAPALAQSAGRASSA